MKRHIFNITTLIVTVTTLIVTAVEARDPIQQISWPGVGRVALLDSYWPDPAFEIEKKYGRKQLDGISPTQKMLEAIFQWNKDKALTTFSGTDQEKAELIKKIKTTTPAIRLLRFDAPRLEFLVTINQNPTYILRVDNGQEEIFTLPKGKQLDPTGIMPLPADKAKPQQ